ncbi:MAG: phage shock protein E [Alteromonadaceae bacterium]|jgi:phage shock protein E
MTFKSLILIFISTVISLTACAEQTATISQQELLSLMAQTNNQHFVVLDVRTVAEFDEGHITGAVNVSHDEIADNMSELTAYKDKLVIVYCRSGRRAASAESELLSSGFKQLRHLEGDMNAWQAANLPLVKGH